MRVTLEIGVHDKKLQGILNFYAWTRTSSHIYKIAF